MKESVRNLVEWLRGRRVGSPPAYQTDATGDTSLPFTTDGAIRASGMTIFDDRSLRFRSLTTLDGATTGLEEPSAEHAAFKIRMAKRKGFKEAAGTLIERRYSERGYQTSRKQPEDPNLFTFVAYDEGKLVGTVGIRIDSDRGLSADQLYKKEVDTLRSSGCRLCEYTQLALDRETISKPVLAGLFQTAWMLAYKLRGCEFAVIEVNPHHVPFYRRMLFFEEIGEERLNTRVNAPAILLCVPFETINVELTELGPRPERAKQGRSLYKYGFGPIEAEGILQRLRELDRHRA